MRKYFLAIVIFFFTLTASFAQKHKVDSLKATLSHASNDTDKVNTFIKLSLEFESTNLDTALLICQQALMQARRINWDKGMAHAQYDIGIFYDLKGDLDKSVVYEDSAMDIFLKYDLKEMLARVYNVLGNVESEQSQYPKALDHYFKALEIDSVINKKLVPDLYNNIGLVYAEQGNYVRAEEYYFKALKYYEEDNNDDGIATTSSNLGNIYDRQGNHARALKCQFKALEIDIKNGKEDNVSLDYSNIGNSYLAMHDFVKSMDYTLKAIAISKKIGSIGGLSNDYGNIGLVFLDVYETDSANKGFTYNADDKEIYISHAALLDSTLVYEQKSIVLADAASNKLSQIYAYRGMGNVFTLQKKYDKAITSFLRALNLADSLGVLQEKMETSQSLAHTLMKAGNYQQAAKYLDNVLVLKDSLFGKEKEKQIGKLEAQFEYDKKTLEQRKEQEKEQAIAAEQDKRQKLVIAGVSIGLVVVLVFLFLLFRRFKITDEQRKVIEEQKKEVDTAYGKLNNAHLQLQEKDKDITDSIAYARKIQSAILPSEEYLKQVLEEYFVLYKPRDVVSGDFYWCHKDGNKAIFAVVDCTGHGVPGAFMSMIGNSLLNQVVIENRTYDAAEILNKVRTNLVKQLQQNGEPEAVSRDGMDMAICIWDRDKNTVQYAGANNPLYIVRRGISNKVDLNNKHRLQGNDLLEILPDKQPIGYQEGKMDSAFTAQTIQLQKGDYVYIASDGYQDQFGGERNKKFTSRAFRDMLASLIGKSVSEHKSILNNTIENWKRDYAQTDDICIIGVKVI